MSKVTGPLRNIKVLDLSRLLPGPALSWALKGQGAQVDRVEALGGDLARNLGPFVKDERTGAKHGAYFACVNSGKRSIAVDFRSDRGLELVKQLACSDRYDVVIEGFKPGSLEKMGLLPSDILSHSHKVLARISGYGQTGPLAYAPGHDINYVGMAGGLRQPTHAGASVELPKIQVADMAGAVGGAFGVTSKLLEIATSSSPLPYSDRVIDVSLAEAALSLSSPTVLLDSIEMDREGEIARGLLSGTYPFYTLYPTKDNKWVAVGAIEPKFQAEVGEEMRKKGVKVEGKNMKKALAEYFAMVDSDEACTKLENACVTPVLTARQLALHPHHVERKSVVSTDNGVYVKPPAAEGTEWRELNLPVLGEHSRDILVENGYEMEEINKLVTDGIVEQSAVSA
mmetsp:Transcript_30403/g.78623  ORF Transcript_30403/g.78623 Transcript_30403/m.78623 type:complete len:398 (-) Transcript_30403:1605-2798(-)